MSSPAPTGDVASRAKVLLAASAIAVLYVILGRLGLSFAQNQQNATLIWAPTGLSLALLILYGRRLWPGVFIGALLVNLWVDTPLQSSALIAVGNTLEAVVGSLLLERVAKLDPGLARIRDVVSLALCGALLSTVLSATVGVTALFLGGAFSADASLTVWLDWWLGDVGGALTVTPMLLVGLRGAPSWRSLVRRPETWIVITALTVAATAAFGGLLATTSARLLASFLSFPFLVWAGLRLGPRGAVGAAFIATTIAVIGTAQGVGPFVGGSSVLLLWAYASAIGVAATLLAAAVAERDGAETLRQLGEEQRRALEEQLRHAQRLESLGMFAGGVAHDFNNLLTVIQANTDLLRRRLPSSTEPLVEEIGTAVSRAADLCRQILTYAGRNTPETTSVDLAELSVEMQALLRSAIPKNVTIRTEAASEARRAAADATHVRQVVMNLVINAAEAIGARSGAIVLRVGEMECDRAYLKQTFLHSDAEPGRFVYFEVEDDGPGMDDATLERLFDPFFSTKFAGRGLGMAVVVGVVRAHAGAIKVHSQLGSGSRFRVLLPPWTSPIPAEPPMAINPEPRGGSTVLVVDDEPAVLRAARRILQNAGYNVLVAEDGRAAVEVFAQHAHRIDGVLMDVSMPRLSGPEAVIEMRKRRGDIPIVLMSGYTPSGIDIGDCPFLRKPFGTQEVISILGDILRRQQERAHESDST